MGTDQKELAEAASSLTVEDFKWLEQHGMPQQATAEASPPVQAKATHASKPRKKRARPSREWPPVGTILTAEYNGTRYEAEIVSAPRYGSGKALKILTGPAAGQVCHSFSGAMLKATASQREAQNLGRTGVANGWEFWNVQG
jgi:hypothetical protein